MKARTPPSESAWSSSRNSSVWSAVSDSSRTCFSWINEGKINFVPVVPAMPGLYLDYLELGVRGSAVGKMNCMPESNAMENKPILPRQRGM
jgi:hypothetical protein